MTTWVDRIGPYKVERKESDRPGGQAYLPLRANPSFCVHTTEGDSVAGAWATLNSRYSAPHFIVGEHRIVQMRPLTAQAATLVNHNDRFVQVESVGHAKLTLHTLTKPTWEPLVWLTAFVHTELGVPLARPVNWDDRLPGGTWANNNERRRSGKALEMRGVFGHIDVPDQDPTWHWDPGSLHYEELFSQVRELTGKDNSMALDEYIQGEQTYRQRFREQGGDPGEAPEGKPAHFRAGWTSARFAAGNPQVTAVLGGLTQAQADELYARTRHGHTVEGVAS